MEVALFDVSVKVSLFQAFQDFGDVFDVIFVRVGIDEDVVNVDYNKVIKDIHHDAVDEALIRAGAVAETEGHNKVMIGAFTGSERGPVLSRVLHTDGVKGVLDVNDGKIFRVLESLHSLVNSWERVTIFLCDGV